MSTAEIDRVMGFAPDFDAPVPYMQRTRDYYKAIGYAPYRWAHYTEVPFSPLRKPLKESRLLLLTTAAPYDPAKGDQGPGAAYNSSAKFYEPYRRETAEDHDLRISHIGYDRRHTTAEDPNTWNPLPLLRRLVAEGRIGALTRNLIGVPTNRSHRHTVTVDCPEILTMALEEQADAALLVPNCPVCHQSSSLVARHLESHGIPTVVMGCAKDIVEHCGVPRFLFSDFPLGNSAGRPKDPEGQRATLELALRTLETAPAPRTTVQNPQRWSEGGEWKLDYNNVERIPEEELQRRREEFNRQKQIAREVRTQTLAAE